jgi:hypothetical protein
MSPSAATNVHVLKVTLRGIKPPVWRRVELASSATLADLHAVIQAALGWWDYHLHEFEIAGVRYGVDDGEGWGEPPKKETGARLAKVAPAGARFSYTYDFGDNWEHTVEVEKIVPAEPGRTYPAVVGGRRACPPEDCGGTWGYANFLDAISDPAHDEHESMLEWVGHPFDPEAFDPAEFAQRLKDGPMFGDDAP